MEIEIDRLRSVFGANIKHDAAWVETLGGSEAPILVSSDYKIVDGNHRYLSAKRRGEMKIEAVVLPVPSSACRELWMFDLWLKKHGLWAAHDRFKRIWEGQS